MKLDKFNIPGHTIVRIIGEGGMGTVYIAEDNILQRQVAVKLLKSEYAPGAETARRFQSEAVTLAKLRHPNITMLYNMGQTDGCQYMIMEYVEGETLESILKKRGALPVEEVLNMAAHTLEGLQHAHNKDVIHRDLKPSNLMLSVEGEVKIMDFGISRIVGGSRLTRVGQVVGTPQYMSPEQIRGMEGNQASDIYSMGIVLYELLTGTTPFDSDSEFDIMQAHTGRKPVPPILRNPAIPEALNNAVLKALEKEPSKRFNSAAEFKQCLLQINVTPVAGRSSRKPFPKTAPSWKLPLKIDRQYLLGAGFLIVSLLMAFFVLFRGTEPETIPETTISEHVSPGLAVEQGVDMGMLMQGKSTVGATTPPPESISNTPIDSPTDSPTAPGQPMPTPDKKVEKPVAAIPKEKDKKQEEKDNKQVEKEKEKEKKQDDASGNEPSRETPHEKPHEKPRESSHDKPVAEHNKTPKDEKKSESDTKPQVASLGKTVLIPRGSEIKATLDQACDYDSVTNGMSVTLSVAEPFVRSGLTIIPTGAKVHAKLYQNTRKRELELQLLEVDSITGKRLKLLNTTYQAAAFSQGEWFKMNLEYDRMN